MITRLPPGERKKERNQLKAALKYEKHHSDERHNSITAAVSVGFFIFSDALIVRPPRGESASATPTPKSQAAALNSKQTESHCRPINGIVRRTMSVGVAATAAATAVLAPAFAADRCSVGRAEVSEHVAHC